MFGGYKRIENIVAREILDSRGNPTVEVTVTLKNGISGCASVPSGASTGSHEAYELRDAGKRFGGKGVLQAVSNVNRKIAPLLKGLDVIHQHVIDSVMIERDGTQSKKKLGANAILGVSLACARAGALVNNVPLYKYIRTSFRIQHPTFSMPFPMMNLINGGRHADWASDIQEFMIIPQQKTFALRVQCGAEIFHNLHTLLKKYGHQTGIGDEGGFAPQLNRNEEALELLVDAIDLAGYRKENSVKLGMDIAASEFYNKKTKRYELKLDKKSLDAKKLCALYQEWIKKYPIISIEDPLAEDDWNNWKLFTHAEQKNKLMIIGDDLFTTNHTRLEKGIALGAANAILIKLNQIGTLTETIATIKLAQKHNYKVIISHRSGETNDAFISDLAVAVNADYIKAGSLSRGERVSKYNRLMEIETELKHRH